MTHVGREPAAGNEAPGFAQDPPSPAITARRTRSHSTRGRALAAPTATDLRNMATGSGESRLRRLTPSPALGTLPGDACEPDRPAVRPSQRFAPRADLAGPGRVKKRRRIRASKSRAPRRHHQATRDRQVSNSSCQQYFLRARPTLRAIQRGRAFPHLQPDWRSGRARAAAPRV